MQKYVLGFAFDQNHEHLVMIRKQKPDWQKNKLNGVGGKIEAFDLTPALAMTREFHEETGVYIHNNTWKQFLTLHFDHAEVICFGCNTDDVLLATTRESEEVSILTFHQVLEEIRLRHTIDNIMPILNLYLLDTSVNAS